MANDALWMRCRFCGAGLMITKYYPDTDLGELATSGATIAAWLTAHLRERREFWWHVGQDLDAMPGIEFVTEDPTTSTGQMYYGPEQKPHWDYPFPPAPREALDLEPDTPA